MALITCTIVIAAIRCRRSPTLRRLKFIKAEPSARYAAERLLVFERRIARSRLSRSINWRVAQARIPVRARLHEWVSGRDRSPLARRSADELFESSAERGFGLVADFMSDYGNPGAGICQPLGGDLHSPLSEILNRRTAHQMDKSISQCGA